MSYLSARVAVMPRGLCMECGGGTSRRCLSSRHKRALLTTRKCLGSCKVLVPIAPTRAKSGTLDQNKKPFAGRSEVNSKLCAFWERGSRPVAHSSSNSFSDLPSVSGLRAVGKGSSRSEDPTTMSSLAISNWGLHTHVSFTITGPCQELGRWIRPSNACKPLFFHGLRPLPAALRIAAGRSFQTRQRRSKAGPWLGI